jgi:hypothetical protein
MLKRGSIITLIFVTLLTGLVYLGFLMTPEPPTAGMERARKAIAEARKQNAGKYATELFNSSEKAYNHAVRLLEAENKRFILFRNYDLVDSTCKEAFVLAEMATKRSLANSQKLEISLSARIDELKSLSDRYTHWMNFMPVPESTRKKFLNGKMHLAEASIDFEKQNLIEGDKKVRDAGQKINESVNELNKLLERYFANYPEWVKWHKESVEKSKATHTSLIVVDKMARKCMFYKNGKLKKTYPIELGRNWIGDKRFRGDKSTPEGRYSIVKKLDNSHTKYYKALLINYPNDDDKQEFAQDKKRGDIPKNAHIGGLIEIHGHGGKGADWTDGCVALEDEDMKDLFNHAAISTPVTIVGSLIPLDKLLKQ